MKKIISLFILLIFISGCISLEKPKKFLLEPLQVFKKADIDSISISRGIAISFLDDLPPSEVYSGFPFNIAGSSINYMPYQTEVNLRLSSDYGGDNEVQGSFNIEPAFVEDNKILGAGNKISVSGLSYIDEETFEAGQFSYKTDYNLDVGYTLYYSYPVKAVLNSNLCLRKPKAVGVDCPTEESISESSLGIAAKTLPITIDRIDKKISQTVNPSQIKLETVFYVKDKGTSGLTEKNKDAEVTLEIGSLTGYRTLRDTMCFTNQNSNYRGNSKITFKLEEGASQVTCISSINFEEDAIDYYLAFGLSYNYETILTKSVSVKPFNKG